MRGDFTRIASFPGLLRAPVPVAAIPGLGAAGVELVDGFVVISAMIVGEAEGGT